MNNKSCFFIGHREASTEILPALESAIEQHISEYGVTEFIVGGYGGFDRLAASAVIRAKRQHPQITLVLLLPYHPAERPIEKPKGFDSTYYPPDMEKVPRRLAIVRANRCVVDHVDYVIAYAWPSGKATPENWQSMLQKRERKGFDYSDNAVKIQSLANLKVITFILIFNLLKVMTLCYNDDDRFRRKEVVLWQKRRHLPM